MLAKGGLGGIRNATKQTDNTLWRIPMKQNNQTIKDNDMNKQKTTTTTIVEAIRELPLRIVRNGMLFALGFFGTTILAVAISGTIKTWTTGEVLKSADLNTTIASLKTAIEGITSSQWTTTGANISYTAGNVGIGASSPGAGLDIAKSNLTMLLGATDAETRSDSTIKISRVGSYPFTNSAKPTGIFMTYNTASVSELNLGGGSGAMNAVTDVIFHTAANTSTLAGTERMRITSTGLVGIGRTPTTHPLEVAGSAGLTTGTAWTNISDERLKDIDGTISSALDNLLKLNPIKYKYNEASGKLFKNADGKSKYGFTAQNVKSVFPEMVITDDKGYLWYNPSGFEAILTSAIKEVAFRLRSTSDSVSVVTQKIDSLEKEKAANEKKLLALEESNQKLIEDNKRLREMVETHGRASLRLEDRLRAIENTQMARK